MGWYKYVGLDGKVIGLDHFGASAPAAKVFEAFGITADHAYDIAKKKYTKVKDNSGEISPLCFLV